LVPLQAGSIGIPGLPLAIPGDEPPAEARHCGFVFQDHALFPHLNVARNVAFGLHALDAKSRLDQVAIELEKVGLADRATSYPHTLSGGEQQRVALARALAPQPAVMLLDEPFANVDANLRRRLREDTRIVLRDSGAPSVLVTHSATEAMSVADRIAVIDDGHIVQVATPQDMWQNPSTPFVAELLFATDAILANCNTEGLHTAFGDLPMAPGESMDEQYAVVIRPEAIELTRSRSGGSRVTDVRALGDRFSVTVTAQGERLRALLANAPDFSIGASVEVRFDAAGVYVFSQYENESH
ncbi:MAG: ABC transporter ATP-binding protein, partial [Gammaproteobacteria bacterium]|nr:ABC transporter ATP-binding protein [Gammaproteobacteria bacterium]